jgi:hypothetical protein
VLHTLIDAVDDDSGGVTPGAVDDALGGMQRFEVYRVRFHVANTALTEIKVTPLLEVGTGSAPTSWRTVPEVNPVPGVPFYAASDAQRTFQARTATIDAADLRAAPPSMGLVGTDGISSSGVNPAPAVRLPGGSYTEIEFAVRATVDAAWRQDYTFRLAPSPEAIGPAATAAVTMRARPSIVLTLPPTTTTATTGPRYALAMAVQPQAGPGFAPAANVNPASPHISSALTSDGCAACHSPHRATDRPLIGNTYRINPLRTTTEGYSGADFTLCLTCHNEEPFADTSGSGSSLTNFPGHGYHLGHIDGEGNGGVDIETPGDGQGNALCAECHYNIHGTPASERGLVQFAPDVVASPTRGTIEWNQDAQTCTLMCHDKDHVDFTFSVAPPSD